jgi:urease accessory protein
MADALRFGARGRTVSIGGLLLGDSRFPAGGHAYSGGVEPAVTAGTVTDLDSLEWFLRGRLRTAGLVAAALSATACAGALACAGDQQPVDQMVKYPEFRGAGFAPEIPDGAGDHDGAGRDHDGARRDHDAAGGGGPTGRRGNGAAEESAAVVRDDAFWRELDAEADARTPAPAQRAASRRQGRALLRAARVAWPDATGLARLAASVPGKGGPHHAVVLGAAAGAAGCAPAEAARIAAYQAVAGPAGAAVRLLALDPMRATGVLARLAREVDQVAALGAGHAEGPLGDLPGASAPALDLLAEAHIRAEARLFES